MDHSEIESILKSFQENSLSFTAEELEEIIGILKEIPKTLIVTNIPTEVYDNECYKREFEKQFLVFDSTCTFTYLKSFYRAKVFMSRSEAALLARSNVHNSTISGLSSEPIKCYFAQDTSLHSSTEQHLLPPVPEKQFLISPPSSPPVGWEPKEEAEPVINYDLLAALANLAPGESHEIHAAQEDKPCIVITPCEDPGPSTKTSKAKIVQTKCPERNENA